MNANQGNPGAGVGPGGGDPPADSTFIELQLVDLEGKPVAFASYSVTASDGKVFSGGLDADGFARIEGVAKGSCKVTFPDFHGDEWSAA